jgi:betaine-aldehyde dehydrogenase
MSTETPPKVALHWIDGAWVDSGEHHESINPATGEVIGSYSMGTPKEAESAIAAAKRAFRAPGWRTDRMLRSKVLNAMADRFEERTDDLVELLALENGKTKPQARLEVDFAPETLRFNAALALTDCGRDSQVSEGEFSVMVRQPAGVAGIIAPWNSPVALGVRSLAPALAAGCTAVMNLPRQTAQVNSLMAEIVGGTEGLPPGVANTLTGGHVTGDVLVTSPDVPVISFTGSTATGKEISKTASENLKRVGLELGGKTPLIVFDDADLDLAMPIVVAALTVFAGQFCMTGSRVLVQHEIADRFLEELADRLRQVRPGPAADPASEIGPMIDQASVARVDALVEAAIEAGAKPLVRGGPATDPALAGGAFFHPALLEVGDSELPVVQQEVFGPVQVAQRFGTEDEAVELANATEYGLSACVWSRDADRPLRVARRLEAGLVSINSWANLAVEMEEGGWKASGLGRLGGVASLDDFTEYKQITQNYR